MKKLLISIALVTSLSGCAVWDAYWMAGYDNIEYALTNKIRTVSQLSVENCKDQNQSKDNFENLYAISIELHNYSQHIPRNDDAYKITGNLVELTKQGRELYGKENKVSETFCKLKLQQVNRAAETAQKVIGAKTR